MVEPEETYLLQETVGIKGFKVMLESNTEKEEGMEICTADLMITSIKAPLMETPVVKESEMPTWKPRAAIMDLELTQKESFLTKLQETGEEKRISGEIGNPAGKEWVVDLQLLYPDHSQK